MKIATPCLSPNCPRLAVKAGRCLPCAAPILAERQQQRNLYASAKHRSWRKVILSRDRICQECRKAPSVVADHIRPLKEGGTWDYSNGRGLCKHCDGVLGRGQRLAV